MSRFKCGPVTVTGIAMSRMWRIDYLLDGKFAFASRWSKDMPAGQAKAESDAALATLKAEMLRDLLTGPEWEGLEMALAASIILLESHGDKRRTGEVVEGYVSTIRRLADALKEVSPDASV